MRLIKITVIIVLLTMGFIFECELFHNEIWNFEGVDFLSSRISFSGEDERIKLLMSLKKAADKNAVDVFATKINCSSEIKNELCIFGDTSNVRNAIEKKSEISEKKYVSLFSGEMIVKYYSFSEMLRPENRYIDSVSFVGKENDIMNLYDDISDEYNISRPQIVGASELDMVYIIWGIIGVFLVLLTCIEVVRNKKEAIIRISMGESVLYIIFKSIVVEMVTDFSLFFIVRWAVYRYISGEFAKNNVFICFALGVIISCLVYFSYSIYDMKMAFSNADTSRIILNGTYIIKLVVTAVSMVTIITNIEFLLNDVYISEKPKIISEFENYSYISLRYNDSYEDDHYEYDIFKHIYTHAKPVICEIGMDDDDNNVSYVIINENASQIVDEFADGLNYETDVDAIYFIPEKINNSKTIYDADDCLREMIINIDNLHIQIVPYDKNRSINCIDCNSTTGIKTVYNPVVVYSLYNGSNHLENIIFQSNISNVMFKIEDSDIQSIINEFDLNEKGIELSKTSVKERYDYNNNILRKILAFCTSLCTFVFILQILLIININRMEYRLNAVELSLKKVLGYGIWRKNGKLLWSEIIFNVVIIIALVIFGLITEMFRPFRCIEIGFVIIVAEVIVSIYNILWIENNSVQKILKGGCL